MHCHLFIDEVGNADLQSSATDENVRYLSLTGVLAKQSAHARTIQPQLDAFKDAHFGSGTAGKVVLHRREIMRREGSFVVLRDDARRKAFDSDLLTLLERLPYLATTVTIDKKLHLDRYSVWHMDPYHYCIRCLVERYVLWLRRHDLRGDVVAEPRYKGADKRVKRSFRQIYEHGTEHIPPRIVQAHLLSHDIKFQPKSANVAGLQICDLVAHPSFRSMRLVRVGRSIPNDFGTKVVEILMKSKYSREPVSGMIQGWGRKWLP